VLRTWPATLSSLSPAAFVYSAGLRCSSTLHYPRPQDAEPGRDPGHLTRDSVFQITVAEDNLLSARTPRLGAADLRTIRGSTGYGLLSSYLALDRNVHAPRSRAAAISGLCQDPPLGGLPPPLGALDLRVVSNCRAHSSGGRGGGPINRHRNVTVAVACST